MAGAVFRHGAIGGDERLGDDLAAEDALAFFLIRALAAEQVMLEAFDIEEGEEVAHGIGAHGGAFLAVFIFVRRSN